MHLNDLITHTEKLEKLRKTGDQCIAHTYQKNKSENGKTKGKYSRNKP